MPNDIPVVPLEDEVAAKVGCSVNAVDEVFFDIGIRREISTRPNETLTLRSLRFAGTKTDSKIEDGPYEFVWKDLSPGLYGLLSDGVNLIGKTTVLEVMMWAVKGRPRELKPEVRKWIDEVELDFTIGRDHYRIAFSDGEFGPDGNLSIYKAGKQQIIRQFTGDEAFETAIDNFMLERFGLVAVPNIRHENADGEAAQYDNSWTAYASSLYIEGSHTAILGDVAIGGLWWRMLNLFMGVPYAEKHILLKNALIHNSQDGVAMGKATRATRDAIQRLRQSLQEKQEELAKIQAKTIGQREVDQFWSEYGSLKEEEATLQSEITKAETHARALKTERDEARAHVRRLQEGKAARRLFSGLRPVCCPRCSASITKERLSDETENGKCSVCDRSIEFHDDEVERLIDDAQKRVQDLSEFERAAKLEAESLIRRQKQLFTEIQINQQKRTAFLQQDGLQARRRTLEDEILMQRGALEEFLRMDIGPKSESEQQASKILKSAETIAQSRMKLASTELFTSLQTDIVTFAREFGFRGLEGITIQGNAIRIAVSGVESTFTRQSKGQRLRLRIALILAMVRLAQITGFGHHPGLLFIDSLGSEESGEENLQAMIRKIGEVTSQVQGAQVFVASARGAEIVAAFDSKNVRQPKPSGAFF